MPPPLPWLPRGVFRLLRPAVSLAPERSHARLEVEVELNGVSNGWTDLTPDLRTPLDITYGISSTGPLALVASTGRMAFSLANGETNSMALLGYYTPGHPNCRAGFRIGIRVRFGYQISATRWVKFVGWLDEVNPIAGKYRERQVMCAALDWMNEAASANPIIGIQSSKRSDQVLSVVQAAVARQPQSTNYDVGLSTFLYSLDSLDNESGSVLSELQRIAVSEGNGHIFIRGNTTAGGELRMENRTARFAFTPVATFNETMHGLTITQARSQIRNKVKVTTHPRRVGSVTTDVLFSDQAKPLIPVGATQVLGGDYTDPSNAQARIGGADMTPPVATTDYTMNTLITGAGTDLTASFLVSANYGGNSLEHTITNQSASAGYVTKRQARGRTIKDLDPVDTVVTDQNSINAYGETRFYYDMPYQDDAAVAITMANYVLSVWGTPRANEATVTWRPRTDADKAIAMGIEVGSPITLQETMTGINGPFFVNQVTLRAEEGDVLEFEWLCQLAVGVPFIQSRITSAVGTDQTSHTVTMPSGVVSGDLIISIISVDETPTITWPAGWTRLAELQNTTLTGTMSAAYRQADGTEGASITVTTSSAQESTHVTYRILGAQDVAIQPPEAAIATGTPAPVRPCPILTPTGGTKTYLWIAAVGLNTITPILNFQGTVPPNYGNTLLVNPTSDGWAEMSSDRSSRAASESPGNYTGPSSPGWVTITIGVHPKS